MARKHRHLTLDDRMEIQLGLKAGLKLIEIANKINKDPRTISAEIKRNLMKKINDRYLFSGNKKTYCQFYLKFPYVCDNCKIKSKCLSDFYYYSAKEAQRLYETRLINARIGANLTEKDLAYINVSLEEGLSKGQSIEHIAQYKDFPVSVRTLYRYIENNNIDIKTHQLRIKPRLKRRKSKTKAKPSNGSKTKGRTFVDFLKYISDKPGTFTVQLDTVIGRKSDKKVLMTLIVIELHFFYAVLLNRHAANEVRKAFDGIETAIGLKTFRKLFPYILTDRGHEFIHHQLIEKSIDGYHRTKVYYCDPLASYQKGAIESYHRLLRYILPKGKTLDHLTPAKVNLINSHLNSYKLKSNQYKTAYDLVSIYFGNDVLDKLKVRKIDPDSVNLTPFLVK